MSEEKYIKHWILFVDDEEKTRKYFGRLFGAEFNVLLAKDGVEGLELFKKNKDKIAVVITDQKMPNMTGAQLLTKIAEIKPLCVRILSTAYADIEAAVVAVNQGKIYQYVTKPWEVSDLETSLKRSMDYYILQEEREGMLKQKLSAVQTIASSDRVLTTATVAVFQNDQMRRIGEALKILVQLAEVGAKDEEENLLMDEELGWRELYRRHLNFLRALKGSFTKQVLECSTLDYSQHVSVKEVMDPLVGGESYFEWSEGETSSVGWPTPLAVVRGEMHVLLNALEAILKDAGLLLVSEVEGGVEIRLSSRLLAKNLKAFRSVTKKSPSKACLTLAISLFRLSHVGAQFSIHPEEKGGMIRLRVTFDPNFNPSSALQGWDSIDFSLSDDNTFWASCGGARN